MRALAAAAAPAGIWPWSRSARRLIPAWSWPTPPSLKKTAARSTEMTPSGLPRKEGRVRAGDGDGATIPGLEHRRGVEADHLRLAGIGADQIAFAAGDCRQRAIGNRCRAHALGARAHRVAALQPSAAAARLTSLISPCASMC